MRSVATSSSCPSTAYNSRTLPDPSRWAPSTVARFTLSPRRTRPAPARLPLAPMRRVNVVAHGLVQGVFFRASARDEARRHDVTGWIRNRRDGAVEAEFEGSDDA